MKLSVIAKIISFPISPFWEEAAILVGQSALLEVDYIMLTTGDLQGILDLRLRGQVKDFRNKLERLSLDLSNVCK
jgi:hypothetical protein